MDVKLDAFEGPLDLLLQLIRQHKIDIYDIPISQLTDSYLQEIAKLPPDMGQLSEFLVMAATLLEIKSRMLLPRPKLENAEEGEDPREALVQKLLAYKQTQAIAQGLQAITPIGERLTGHGDGEAFALLCENVSKTPNFDEISVPLLLDLFVGLITRKEERRDTVRAEYGELPRDRFTVTDKVNHMRHLLASGQGLSLKSMFATCYTKGEMVVTFLALLEMVRQGEARAIQGQAFGDVDLVLATVNK